MSIHVGADKESGILVRLGTLTGIEDEGELRQIRYFIISVKLFTYSKLIYLAGTSHEELE